MKISIQFLGAAGTVTGSKFLIEAESKRILVDCGLFQGLKKLRLLNWEQLPFDAASVDLVLVTHGHLDHTGYLARFVKAGYKGEIWATAPTLEIAKIILEDSAKIQEEDAERANAKGFSKHKPALPLYDEKDVKKTLGHFAPKSPDKWIIIDENLSCRFRYNSHIIGSTFIELKVRDKIIVFSGDIGRSNDLLMYPPKKPEQADILFIESTYGDRLHPLNAEERLQSIIQQAAERDGTIIIPSFAVERTQMLMYLLWQLKEKRKIPQLPIYMDSPMGTNVLDVFKHNTDWHKLPKEECEMMCRDIRLIKTIQETQALALDKRSKIIIAGSGMASGGRVLTYFQHYLGDRNATILLVGYQAEGTRGRSLLDGEKAIKIFGQFYHVKATIENVEGLSAHADQEGLLEWMSEIKEQPKRIFIVHGEQKAAKAFREKIREKLGWDSEVAELFETAIVEI